MEQQLKEAEDQNTKLVQEKDKMNQDVETQKVAVNEARLLVRDLEKELEDRTATENEYRQVRPLIQSDNEREEKRHSSLFSAFGKVSGSQLTHSQFKYPEWEFKKMSKSLWLFMWLSMW